MYGTPYSKKGEFITQALYLTLDVYFEHCTSIAHNNATCNNKNNNNNKSHNVCDKAQKGERTKDCRRFGL